MDDGKWFKNYSHRPFSILGKFSLSAPAIKTDLKWLRA